MDEIFLSLLCAMFYIGIKWSDNKTNKVKFYMKWYMYYMYGLIVTIFVSIGICWRGRNIHNAPILVKLLKPLTRFHGTTWHLENKEVLGSNGGAVIISNHQSSMDIVGIINSWTSTKNLVPVAKKELLYYGPIGMVAYLIGVIFIDRKYPKKAYKTLDTAIEHILKDEVKIWMFPEGTRNRKGKTKLLPFKRGAFSVAVATQTPIIPVVYSPFYFIDEEKYIFNSGGHVIMRCLEPVPTTGLTMEDVPELQDRLYNIILQTYEELSKEVFYKFAANHANTES